MVFDNLNIEWVIHIFFVIQFIFSLIVLTANKSAEMDFEIVKLILETSGEDISKIKLEESKIDAEDNKIDLRNDQLTSGLARSLANFLCHKVSPAAHQRYLVRTNLIVCLIPRFYEKVSLASY